MLITGTRYSMFDIAAENKGGYVKVSDYSDSNQTAVYLGVTDYNDLNNVYYCTPTGGYTAVKNYDGYIVGQIYTWAELASKFYNKYIHGYLQGENPIYKKDSIIFLGIASAEDSTTFIRSLISTKAYAFDCWNGDTYRGVFWI